jgi:Bacterial Ig-like domain (group 3)/Lamin Tail Domain
MPKTSSANSIFASFLRFFVRVATRRTFALTSLLLLSMAYVALADIPLSTGIPATQNFDGIGTAAVATLPTDFRVDRISTVRALGTFAVAGTATQFAGGANLSTSASNGIYNFGSGTTSTGPDRAIGFLSSGTATFSGNLYAQFVNNTGATLAGLQISYGVEKYRGGSNPAGFRIQMFYSTDGSTWTSAGNDFLTSFGPDANNNGFATAPGVTVSVSKTLNVSINDGSKFYLAWNYSVSSGATTTNAQALAIDDISVLAVAGTSPTNPAGTGSANPSTVQAGNSTLLTVSVTPGANPVSTGLAVSANLSSVGGSAAQQFFDDGTHGDAIAGDNVFSFQATVPAATTAGLKTIRATITDAQSRSGSASISLNVTPSSTPPTGSGSANPSSLQSGNSTLLTVNVTPGSNPVSTGIGVVGDLSSIGGSSSQQFFDDGTHGDVVSNDNIFSFFSSVPGSTTPGAKSLPITISDAQARTSTTAISLTVQPPPPPMTVKISQVYGGGGNSGSTYTNDFIEIFNEDVKPVDISLWSVQYNSAGATGTWQATSVCPASSNCILLPGHYYLIKESQGTGGTTSLPAPDAVGTIAMSATNGKVALVATTTPLTGACPTDGNILDLVGYGSSNCSETTATAALTNTSAAVRRGNGCIDSDNNFNDFVTIGPIPRNSAAPANSCGGDPSQPSGTGIASPASLDPASNTLLTVHVTPASAPPSTGLAVAADLTSIGGDSSQPMFDDETHGDAAAEDDVFSFEATVGAFIPTGVKNILATITDAQGRIATAPITLTVQSPTCGVERWSVKTGTDPDAPLVDLNSATVTTIQNLGALPAPPDPPGPPLNARIQPTETTVYILNATMTLYKKENDVDYHIVLQDDTGNTLIVEVPSPACVGTTSPFAAAIASARAKFDSRFTALPSFQTANIPVRVKGVAFFDFIHGQTGVAPNGIELHPVLDINFTAPTTTTLASSTNPSQFGQSVTITAAVSNGGTTKPTGNVTFLDGGTPLGNAALDQNGQTSITTTALTTGPHTITASYEGDDTSAPSTSSALAQVVNKADQTITFASLAGKTFGDPDFTVSATASSGLAVSFSIPSGPATISGNTVHITGAGSVTVRASQAGDANYNAAPDVDRSFNVAQANQTISFAALPDKTYGDAPFTVSATGGGSGNPVTFAVEGNCFSGGMNGATITITGAGSCKVTASQAGNSNYNAAPDVDRSFNVAQANQTISFAALPDKTYGDAPFTVSATASSSLAVSFSIPSGPATISGNTVHITGAGSVTVRASQGGDANYNAAPDVDRSFNVAQAGQTIAFAALPDKTYGDAPFTVSATGGGSGNPVTFAAEGNCSSSGLNGATITITGAGSCKVTASQAGNSNYNAAPDVSHTFTMNQAGATITVNGYSGIYDGHAHGATGSATGVNGEELSSLLDFGASFTDAPGGTANWSFAGNANYRPASGSVSIVIAKATAAFSNLSSPAITAGASSTPLGGRISFGLLIPTGNVAITLNGVTQNANIQPDGSFSSNFATGSLVPANPPYTIAYGYGGDTNFNSASGTGTLTISYGALPLYDQTKAARSGSTIPIRFLLTNAAGTDISSTAIVVTAVRVVQTSTNATTDVQDAGNSNPDNNFRFDASLGATGGYIFNLSTSGLGTGTYNLLYVVQGDPVTHALMFQVR